MYNTELPKDLDVLKAQAGMLGVLVALTDHDLHLDPPLEVQEAKVREFISMLQRELGERLTNDLDLYTRTFRELYCYGYQLESIRLRDPNEYTAEVDALVKQSLQEIRTRNMSLVEVLKAWTDSPDLLKAWNVLAGTSS
jgi:hypothetical protein